MAELEINSMANFVKMCKSDPEMLRQPEMTFFKEYLERLLNNQ